MIRPKSREDLVSMLKASQANVPGADQQDTFPVVSEEDGLRMENAARQCDASDQIGPVGASDAPLLRGRDLCPGAGKFRGVSEHNEIDWRFAKPSGEHGLEKWRL